MAKKSNGNGRSAKSNGQSKKQPEDTRVSRALMNRTGIAASPKDSKDMIESVEQGAPTMMSDGHAADSIRSAYMKGADPVGTVPPPASMKGMAKTAMQALKGDKATVLIDRIAERLAFERSGVRAYAAVIGKLDVLGTFEGGPKREDLVHYHDEEREHFAMLIQCMEELGADPTAMTPSADIVGVESSGVLKVILDPRTTLSESLHALLVLELVDRDGWQMLVELADKAGQKDMADRFRRAEREEEEHLAGVRRWVSRYAVDALEGKSPGTQAQQPSA